MTKINSNPIIKINKSYAIIIQTLPVFTDSMSIMEIAEIILKTSEDGRYITDKTDNQFQSRKFPRNQIMMMQVTNQWNFLFLLKRKKKTPTKRSIYSVEC